MISNLANKDTFDFLGTKAQYLVVKAIIERKSLFLEVAKYLNPAVFTVAPLQKIVAIAQKAYDKEGKIYGWRDLEYILKQNLRTTDEMAEYSEAFKILTSDDTEGMETAVEIGVNHLKTLEMKRILRNSAEALKDGGYTPDRLQHLKEELDAVDRIDTNEDSLSPEAFFELVVSDKVMERVATGFDELDKAMKGGLPKGNLGLIIAGTGVGKTTFGSTMAMRSALAGNNVIHIFFEDSVPEIGRKYYSTLTGRWTSEYESVDPEKKEELRSEIMGNNEYREALKRITPKRMRNGEDRIDDILNFIRHKISMGQKPDLVIIDYMSCLKLSSDKQFAANKEFELLEKAMKRLECFAQDEEIAIWAEQQTNRNGAKSDTMNDRVANIQGSYRMVQPAAFVLYLERSHQGDDKWNRANVYMDKCRGCEPQEWDNILFNNGNCTIDFNDMNDELPIGDEYDFRTDLDDIIK